MSLMAMITMIIGDGRDISDDNDYDDNWRWSQFGVDGGVDGGGDGGVYQSSAGGVCRKSSHRGHWWDDSLTLIVIVCDGLLYSCNSFL